VNKSPHKAEIERKVFRIKKAGSIDDLIQQTELLEAPDRGEVVIKVHAIGLNFADIFALQGLYSATPKGSFIPGLEYAGDVIDIGTDVTNTTVGSKVFGVTRFGAYADYIKINSGYISPLPEKWSFSEGAAFPVQALTAYYALVNLGNIQKGQKVLIHSAAGGVGLWANRIAKRFGGITIGAVGNSSKLNLLDEEGFDYKLVRSATLHDDVLELLDGERPDIVLECIGGQIFKESYRLMANQGRIIPYGAAHFGNGKPRANKLMSLMKYLRRPKVDPMLMMRENKSVMGFNLIWLFEKQELFQKSIQEIDNLGLEAPIIGHTFPFDKLKDAIKLFQTGTTTGKVVVEI